MNATITESCCCGATITLSSRQGGVLIGYQADDFRKAHAACRAAYVADRQSASSAP